MSSSNLFMGGGCQKRYNQDALGILGCSIRNPVKEQQTLQVRIAQQYVRKIKQIKNREKKKGLGGLGRQQVELESAICPCNKGQAHPTWAGLAKAQPAGPEK